MSRWLPLPEWAKAPAYCLACSTLSIEAAGLDAEGDLVCPRCESVDVYLAEPAEGVRVVEEADDQEDAEDA